MADPEEEEPIADSGQHGGYAAAQAMPAAGLMTHYLSAGVAGGLIAGAILGLAEMAGAAVAGASALAPVRLVASIPMGQAAFSSSAAPGTLLAMALFAHLAIAVVWGGVFGLVMGSSRDVYTPGSFALAGLIFGVLVWMVDFFIVAPAFWPQLAQTNTWMQLLAHAIFFGIPLGLCVGYATEGENPRVSE